jgi:Ser/Thr protein kinase RdoA (MazF antagonist)
VTQLFLKLVPDRVLDAVEAMGLRATGYCLALNSLENRVYEVELEPSEIVRADAPTRCVIKFYRPGRWSRAGILDEHTFLADLHAAEIPVVAPLDLGGGRGTLGEIDGIFYAVFPKVRGRAPDELDDAQLVQLGRLLARIHTVGAARPAPDRLRLDPETFGVASLDALAATQWIPLELSRRYQAAASRIVDLARPRLRDLAMIRIHGDCHFGNLLWGSEGPFFVDFDDMVTGPAVQDLWMLARGRGPEADRERLLLARGYEEMRAFDRAELALVELLRGLRILRYSAWIASHWDDPAFPRAFPHFPSHEYWTSETDELERVAALVGAGQRAQAD